MVRNDSVYTWVCSIVWIDEVVLRLRLIRVPHLYYFFAGLKFRANPERNLFSHIWYDECEC